MWNKDISWLFQHNSVNFTSLNILGSTKATFQAVYLFSSYLYYLSKGLISKIKLKIIGLKAKIKQWTEQIN